MTQMFSPLHYITTLQLLLISFGLCAFCWTALYAVRKCEPLVVFLERGRLFVLQLQAPADTWDAVLRESLSPGTSRSRPQMQRHHQ